ncbi:endophilin-A [Lepeophtheirus salmonis]|nr:endophilin-A-like [Lepeophtheirus salmonis]XP_040577012.1 endophilin-A-like [Lepeophtheirus salmonis]XP_040577013.1 endophilin-A-like [Lepeophtheirus salmonis]
MAFLPGLKKQFNKANQYMSERITGVEGTKLDTDFTEMEKRTDLFNELTEDISLKTKEYLQPNPTVRAKMAAVKGISKLSGQAKASTYPQPEGTLGDAMCTYGRRLQDFDNASPFASALIECGESMKQMADLKYALDDNVKQNFLEPLHHTQTKDLKEVFHHRKKLHGRKLDFDCKKRKQVPDEELKQAEEKFAESLHLAQLGMHNLLDGSGIEHISQLTQLAEALHDYHKNCTEILQNLSETLYEKTNEASIQPKSEFKPKTLEDLGIDRISDYNLGGREPGGALKPASSNSNLPGNLISPAASPAGTPTHNSSARHSNAGSPAFGDTSAWGNNSSPLSSPTRSSLPSCQAIYSFDAENPGELSFQAGDIIQLKSRIDDNWYDGACHGKSGYFPVSYVSILVPLP